MERLLNGLGAIDGVRVYGPPASAPRTPDGGVHGGRLPADEVADALADEAVFVSTGDFYATTVVERYGLAAAGGLSARGAPLHHGGRGGPAAGGRRARGPTPTAMTQLAALTGMATRVFSQVEHQALGLAARRIGARW